MTAIPSPSAEPAPAATPLQALVILPIVLALVGVFIALSTALGSSEFYAGFFFLFYWAAVQHADFHELPPSALGAFFGVALGWAMQLLVAKLGTAQGSLAFLALILPVLYCLMIGRLRLIVNNSAMLLLTAAGISHVQARASFQGMFINLALAVAFFGGAMWAVQWLRTRGAARQAQAAPSL